MAVVDPVHLWKENCKGGELTHVWGPPNMKGRENSQAPNSSGRWAAEEGPCAEGIVGRPKRSVFARVHKGSSMVEGGTPGRYKQRFLSAMSCSVRRGLGSPQLPSPALQATVACGHPPTPWALAGLLALPFFLAARAMARLPL